MVVWYYPVSRSYYPVKLCLLSLCENLSVLIKSESRTYIKLCPFVFWGDRSLPRFVHFALRLRQVNLWGGAGLGLELQDVAMMSWGMVYSFSSRF